MGRQRVWEAALFDALLDREVVQVAWPQDCVTVAGRLAKGGADLTPERETAEDRLSVGERFDGLFRLDEDVHLTGTEVVPIHPCTFAERTAQSVFQSDQRLEISLGRCRPLQYEDVSHVINHHGPRPRRSVGERPFLIIELRRRSGGRTGVTSESGTGLRLLDTEYLWIRRSGRSQ